MVYVFRCVTCSNHVEHKSRTAPPIECPTCRGAFSFVRDWKAEGVQVDRFAFKVGGTRKHRREPEGAA